MTTTKRQHKRQSKKKQLTDVPVLPKRTYTTISCNVPTVTDYTCIRASQSTTVSASAAGNVNTTYNFTLTNSGAGVGSFDQYRIAAIRFSIIPFNNGIDLIPTASESVVPFYTVIDYDDSNAIGSVAAMLAYNNCIVLGAGESCSRTFKPHMALAAYSGAFTSYANVPAMWIDTASGGVQHYGVKIFVPQATVGQTLLQTWDVVAEYFIEARKSI